MKGARRAVPLQNALQLLGTSPETVEMPLARAFSAHCLLCTASCALPPAHCAFYPISYILYRLSFSFSFSFFPYLFLFDHPQIDFQRRQAGVVHPDLQTLAKGESSSCAFAYEKLTLV